MIKIVKNNWPLILIVILAAILRLYKLGSVPSSLLWDETALGLTELAVRLPSALLGILSIVSVYLLVKEVFGNKQGLWAAFVLAISPWHIEFSRGAWEVNIVVFLVITGIWVFLKGLKNHRLLVLSAVLLGLTFFTYQGAKVFMPLLLFGLVICYWKEIKQIPTKWIIVPLTIFLIMSGPIYIGILRGEEILKQDQSSQNSLTFRGILERYFNHFSGRFLFFEGDWSNKHLGVPDMGVLYLVDFVGLVLGLYYLTTNKTRAGSSFIFYWLIISPVPAAITRDIVSAVRSFNLVMPLTIIVGLGLYQLTEASKNIIKVFKYPLYLAIFLVYFWYFVYFLDQYYLHAPIYNSPTNQYDYKEAINLVPPSGVKIFKDK